MSQSPFDSNALADELDRLFAQGQLSPSAASNDPLIETATRLSAAPRPMLSPEAAAQIHTAVLAAHAAAQRSNPSRLRLRPSSPAQLLVAAALLILLVAGAAYAAQITIHLFNPVKATITPFPTETPMSPTKPQVNVAPVIAPTSTPTNTPTSNPTPIPPTNTSGISNPLPTATPTLAQPTDTDTVTTSPTATPESTAEPTLPVTLVIEGPIQSMNGNVLVIFNLTVVLDPNDPLLKVLKVGEVVRVEGNIGAGTQVITAVHVTTISVETDVNPVNGQVWQDNGTCSNPPPVWAPANGWRARCQSAPSPGNSGGNGNGSGNGNNGNGNGSDNGNGNGSGNGNDGGMGMGMGMGG